MDHKHLEEQLEKDYQLLKELEDNQRVADEPKRKQKLRLDIEELKRTIIQRKAELNALQNQNTSEKINSAYLLSANQNISEQSNLDPKLIQKDFEKPFLSLTDLASFSTYTFPLLRWMYEPVPAKHVCWYFSKIQEFFIFKGGQIPCRKIYLPGDVEEFFRCAYSLPSFDFQLNLNQIDMYPASKLSGAYSGFIKICAELGYKPLLNVSNSDYISHRSLLAILIDLRRGFTQVLETSSSTNADFLSVAEQDILRFMIYIIDFLFKERKARESGRNLDLPEGIVLKLHDILNHAFKAHLGVQLPEREDDGVLADFSSYVHNLSRCWKDSQGNEI